MNLTDEDLINIIFGDDAHWRSVTGEEIIGQSRWTTSYSAVFQHRETGVYIEISWYRGSTEYQDNGIEDASYKEVRPVEKVITVYEAV